MTEMPQGKWVEVWECGCSGAFQVTRRPAGMPRCMTCGWLRPSRSAVPDAGEVSEDTRRLDWLQSEEDRAGRVMSLVVKVNHDRDGSEWANISGNVRAAIDNALAASRQADA